MAEIADITHEDNNLNEYDSVVDNGSISTHADAALAETNHGLKLVVDDTDVNYGVKNLTPPASGILRVRCYIDPNTLTMGNNEKFDFLEITSTGPAGPGPPSILHELKLRYSAGSYQIVLDSTDDNNADTDTSEYNITDEPHWIEFRTVRATGDDASDGYFTLWIDDVLKETVANINNSNGFDGIDHLRFGIVYGIDAGTSGTFYLDELKITDDDNMIGPVVLGVGGAMMRMGVGKA